VKGTSVSSCTGRGADGTVTPLLVAEGASLNLANNLSIFSPDITPDNLRVIDQKLLTLMSTLFGLARLSSTYPVAISD
jgi:hypothetical protein